MKTLERLTNWLKLERYSPRSTSFPLAVERDPHGCVCGDETLKFKNTLI